LSRPTVAVAGPVTVSRLGIALALALQLGGAVVALVGGAALVQRAFPVAAVLVAATLLAKRRDASYIEFVLWLWLLAPALRRVVDLQVGWTPVSPVMAAAPVATLLCLLPALRGRRRLHPTLSAALVIGLVTVCYGAAVGALTLGVGSPAAGVLTWLPPLALGLYVAAAGPAEDEQVRQVVRRTAMVGALVLGVYGVAQFVLVPAWDAFWLRNAPINSAGFPHPFQVRVFSTMNSPAPFASVLGTLMIILTGCRSRYRWAAVLAGVVAFGLSLVRTAWLGYVVALVSLLSPGRVRLLRSAAIGLGLPALVLVLYGGPVAAAITRRLTATTTNATQDESLLDRVSFYSAQLPQVLRDPVGEGIGSVGVATKLSNDGNLGQEGNFDGGALELLYTFGLPGLVFLVATTLAVVAAWRAARQLGDLEKAMAAALVGLLVQLPLSNPLTTPTGVFFWLLVGLLARPPATADGRQASDGLVAAGR
jgi:hypothetical protein